MIAVLVHAANIQDRDGAIPLLKMLADRMDTIRKVWFDAGYAGHCVKWVRQELGWIAEVVRRPDDRSHGKWSRGQEWLPLAGVKRPIWVLPRRWVVERSFAWLGRFRRLSKDYEALVSTSTAMAWLAGMRMLIARLGEENM